MCEFSYKINWKRESWVLRLRIRKNSYSPSLVPVCKRHCHYYPLHEGDNQLLCNVFTKWTSWTHPTIRVDKCHTFGMKKSATASIQYLPYIIAQRERISTVELNNSFMYLGKLGKQFNFGLNIENIKTDIINDQTCENFWQTSTNPSQ